MTLHLRASAFLIAAACALPAGATAPPDAPREQGGRLEATIDGRPVALPALSTAIEADVQGELAHVRVIQTFENPGRRPLNATYLFPLPEDAAVNAMTMAVGDEIVRATIREKEEAKRVFQEAQSAGKAAALLTQHRPNMFTQKVANLMPGLPVTVTLSFVQALPKIDGAHRLTLPLVVGPRYQPAPKPTITAVRGDEIQPGPITAPTGRWELNELPDYPPVAGIDLPKEIEAERVSIAIRLAAGVPVGPIWSDSHGIEVEREEAGATISLAKGRVIDNRDFTLAYRLGGEATAAGILAHGGAEGGHFSMLLTPPEQPQSDEIESRELVFVLDTSGSMHGMPMEASKVFMQAALSTLRPTDTFRILRFASGTSAFSSRPVVATAGNIRDARRYVRDLEASGGTEMESAIRTAFAEPAAPGRLRLVTFLSDGYIGNEADVLRAIGEVLGDARIYALGVGSSVNRYLLEEMARAGRGHVRYVDPTGDVEADARALAERIATPILSDIRIDWGALGAEETVPERLPDLFAGDTLRLTGRYATPGTYRVVIHGRSGGRAARLPVDVTIPADTGAEGAAIPVIWARGQIADAMRQITRLSETDPAQAALKARVTSLGLTHALTTRWTAFVAVSEKVVNAEPQTAVDGEVPLPMPAGVPESAYPDAEPGTLVPTLHQRKAMIRPRSSIAGAAQAPVVGQTLADGLVATEETRLVVANPSVLAPTKGSGFGAAFSGGSTPEPETLLGMLVLGIAWLGALLRRRHRRRALRGRLLAGAA
ncbi:MAG: VIT domain-containing protein [Pseudomonadota bacterium]